MKSKKVLLSYGSGGEESWKFVKEVFLKAFSDPILEKLEDASPLDVPSRIAFTTDAFTVQPIFFKGGDIGKLAVAGTVNDLSVMGAKPLFMSVSFIIEEGFSLEDLERIVSSMAQEAKRCGIRIVTGDTKVVPKGAADGIFISASGIGERIVEGLSAHNLKVGDAILVSGTVGDHGACILAQREGLEFDMPIESDCKGLWDMVERLLKEGINIRAMRDPTRGGLAEVLNEWALQSGVEIEVWEEEIPVKDSVVGLCELLGFEPFHLANEGIIALAVEDKDKDRALEILRNHPYGKDARLIGKVVSREKSRVVLVNSYGVRRLMEAPSGELLPRIC